MQSETEPRWRVQTTDGQITDEFSSFKPADELAKHRANYMGEAFEIWHFSEVFGWHRLKQRWPSR